MDDLISRQDAIKTMCNAVCEYDVPHYPDCDQIKYCDEIQALISLSSAEPRYMGCHGCIHYDQQQTSLICHDCKRYFGDMYEGQ